MNSVFSKRSASFAALNAAVLFVAASMAHAGTIAGVVVPGTADPYLAGMPDGSTASFEDVAPNESPIYISAYHPQAGDIITFTNVTGSVSYFGGTPVDPPDGESFFNLSHLDQDPNTMPNNPENGIADMYGPVDSLIGLFLTDAQPNIADPTPPGPLDFTSNGLGINFTSLSPGLFQPFFIGDGMTDSSVVQQFTVPAGATRLFLASLDGFGWDNNTGQFSVDINIPEAVTTAPVPLPSAPLSALAMGGVALLGKVLRRRSKIA